LRQQAEPLSGGRSSQAAGVVPGADEITRRKPTAWPSVMAWSKRLARPVHAGHASKRAPRSSRELPCPWIHATPVKYNAAAFDSTVPPGH